MSEKKPTSNRPTAAPVAKAEEARMLVMEATLWASALRTLCGSPPCAVWLQRAVSTPQPRPSTSVLHMAVSSSPDTCPPHCLHVPLATPLRLTWTQLRSPKTYVRTHLPRSKIRHHQRMLYPEAALCPVHRAGPNCWLDAACLHGDLLKRITETQSGRLKHTSTFI